MQTIIVEDEARLGEIVDVIHDCWFDLRDVVFDASRAELRIRFRRAMPERRRVVGGFLCFKKVSTPVVECLLRACHVTRYVINDMARVGRYDFDTVRYDEGRKRLLITTSVPLRIEIEVTALKVVVDISDVVLEERTSLAFG